MPGASQDDLDQQLGAAYLQSVAQPPTSPASQPAIGDTYNGQPITTVTVRPEQAPASAPPSQDDLDQQAGAAFLSRYAQPPTASSPSAAAAPMTQFQQAVQSDRDNAVRQFYDALWLPWQHDAPSILLTPQAQSAVSAVPYVGGVASNLISALNRGAAIPASLFGMSQALVSGGGNIAGDFINPNGPKLGNDLAEAMNFIPEAMRVTPPELTGGVAPGNLLNVPAYRSEAGPVMTEIITPNDLPVPGAMPVPGPNADAGPQGSTVGAAAVAEPPPELTPAERQAYEERQLGQSAADRAGPSGIDTATYVPGTIQTMTTTNLSNDVAGMHDVLRDIDPVYAAHTKAIEQHNNDVVRDHFDDLAGDTIATEAAKADLRAQADAKLEALWNAEQPAAEPAAAEAAVSEPAASATPPSGPGSAAPAAEAPAPAVPVTPLRGSNRAPESLVDFLISKGGVRDPGGDLAAMGADAIHHRAAGRLVNPKGQYPDYAREAAVEEGFLPPNAEINDLYNAIAEHMSGRPVYRISDQAEGEMRRQQAREASATEDARYDAFDRVGQAVDQLGVRMSKGEMDHATDLHLYHGIDPVEAVRQAKMASDETALNANAQKSAFSSPGTPIAEQQAMDLGREPSPRGGADARPIVDEIQSILKSGANKRAAVSGPLNDVLKSLYDERGRLESDPRILYAARQNAADMLGKASLSEKPTLKYASSSLSRVISKFDDVIDAARPGFKDYLSWYADQRRPITERETLQGYRAGLTNTDGRMTLAPVQRMLKNIVEARGRSGVNPAKDISPQTMESLFNLRNELARPAYRDNYLSRANGSPTIKKAAFANRLDANPLATAIKTNVRDAAVHLGVAHLVPGGAGNIIYHTTVKPVIDHVKMRRAETERKTKIEMMRNKLLQPSAGDDR